MGIVDDVIGGISGAATGFAAGGPIGGVIGGVLGLAGGSEASAAEQAGEVQLQASREAIAEQRRAEEQLRQDLAPFTGFGVGVLGPLSTALRITPTQTFQPAPLSPSPAAQAPITTAPALQRTPISQAVEAASGGAIAGPFTGGTLTGTAPGATDTRVLPQVNEEQRALLERIQNLTDQRQRAIDQAGGDINDPRAVGFTRIIDGLQTQLGEGFQDLDLTGGLPGTQPARLARQEEIAASQTDLNRLLSGQTGEQAGQIPQQPLTAQPAPFQSRAEGLLGGTENTLLQQAIGLRQDGSQILKNPLLQALQEDVQKRVLANQAARGRLGSGSTLESLQRALIPQALAFREQEISGLTGLGTTIEDLRQREVGNLFQAAGIGGNAAARQGQAGITAAGNIGSLQTFGGQAQALGGLGAAQARQSQIGNLITTAGSLFQQPGDAPGLTRPLSPIGPQAGPFMATGQF